MDHAAHLLAHGSLPIKAIASQVGYSTPYSFSVAFRRARGCPPSEFRERIAERPSMESTADQQAGRITR
jgi:AraC-like DNA-binding protein